MGQNLPSTHLLKLKNDYWQSMLLLAATAACWRTAIHFNLWTHLPPVLRHKLSTSICPHTLLTTQYPEPTVHPSGSNRLCNTRKKLTGANFKLWSPLVPVQHCNFPLFLLFCVGENFLAFYWTLLSPTLRPFLLPLSYFPARKGGGEMGISFLYKTYDDHLLGFTSFW